MATNNFPELQKEPTRQPTVPIKHRTPWQQRAGPRSPLPARGWLQTPRLWAAVIAEPRLDLSR